MPVTPSSLTTAYAAAPNHDDLRHYLEYSTQGIEVHEAGLEEVLFGEFLVGAGAIDRYQLFRALQMQDRMPMVRLGEAVAALGYASMGSIERLFVRFQALTTVVVGGPRSAPCAPPRAAAGPGSRPGTSSAP